MAQNNQIKPLEKGDSSRTMMHTELANEVISAVNRIHSLQIKPEGAGKVIISDANIVIELSGKGGGLGQDTLNACHNGQPSTRVFECGPPQPL